MTLYVAPASKVLTELHRADPGIPPVTTGPDSTTGATVCGLPMLTAEYWMPTTPREGDRECKGCASPGSAPEVVEEVLF